MPAPQPPALPPTSSPAVPAARSEPPARPASAPRAGRSARTALSRLRALPPLLPLRVFLGVTYLYAGLDKLADRHYLATAADPASFASQLRAARRDSPVGALLGPAAHAPTAFALLVAFGETAVGLGVLAGLWGRVAAAGGALISLVLWLTVSFHTHPYYLGNDLAYLAAWVPLVLAGTPQLSLDAALAARATRPGAPPEGRRRAVLLNSAVAALALAGTGLLSGALAARRRGRTAAADPTSGTSADATSPAPTPPSPVAVAPAVAVVAAASVPLGGAVQATDGGNGDPIYVVQPQPGRYAAFSGVCTHAGCTVQPPRGGQFRCPCHSSCFDAATGAVLRGPATTALPAYPVTHEGPDLRVHPRA